MCLSTTFLLWPLKSVVSIYDVLTLPVYFLVQRPWKAWKVENKIKGKRIVESDPYSPYVGVKPTTDPLRDVGTLDELFRWSVQRHRLRRLCGQREVISEADFYLDNGKTLKKLELGEYKWYTYAEIERLVDNLCNGLLELGVQPEKPVLILAETRMEWIIILNSCFRLNVPVATLVPKSGANEILHCIKETGISSVFCSQDCLTILKQISSNIPSLNHIVYMKSIRPVEVADFPDNISLVPFSDLIKSEKTSKAGQRPTPPSPENLAVLMYTSGSTGTPKGVMMSHKNLVAMVANRMDGIPDIKPGDVYIAYLPMAHASEMCFELSYSALGIAIGYSSPLTLTDEPAGLVRGCKGDLSVLQPDLMNFVPVIMERLRTAVYDIVKKKNNFEQELFKFTMEYKMYWYKKGYNTPILNKFFFKNFKSLVGGKLRFLVGGGAPLSPNTHQFIRMVLDLPVLQAYGMTESCGGVTFMTLEDRSVGRVGALIGTSSIRLVDWPEGDYYVTDRPNPRGEILIGGDIVTSGYYKNGALTKSSFTEAYGTRWIHSGDIGEIYPDGTFKIIDRKKNLLKMPNGEYIALGKLEAEFKTCSLVANMCLVGDGLHDYLVALVSPDAVQLSTLAMQLGKDHLAFSDLCEDVVVISSAIEVLKSHAHKCKLRRNEIPKKIRLCYDEWHFGNGLVTPSGKVKRKQVERFYQKAIEEMYYQDNFQ